MNRERETRAAADRRREDLYPWRAWYRTRRWFQKRARQLRDHPFCKMCGDAGMTRPAVIADHVEPHRGDPLKFWYGELQSLCESCHSSAKQREEAEGFSRELGDDGFPRDPRHPFNRKG